MARSAYRGRRVIGVIDAARLSPEQGQASKNGVKVVSMRLREAQLTSEEVGTARGSYRDREEAILHSGSPSNRGSRTAHRA